MDISPIPLMVLSRRSRGADRALVDSATWHLMICSQFVLRPAFEMGCDVLAQFRPHYGDPAGLGVDHVLELVTAARKFRKSSRTASSGSST